MRSKLNFTASALNGVPSWNLTSRRSLKVTLRPSFDVVHDSASQGRSLPSGALNNRHSVTEAMIWYVTAEGEACGSSVGGSWSSPSTRVPPACGSAARGRTPVTTSTVRTTTTGRSERNASMTASWAGSITSATSGARSVADEDGRRPGDDDLLTSRGIDLDQVSRPRGRVTAA